MFLCILHFENGEQEENKNQHSTASVSNLYPASAELLMLKRAHRLPRVASWEGHKAAGVSLPREAAAEGNEPLGFVGIC